MDYIALNGFGHPLNQYFNDRVTCVNKFNWTERNAIDFAIQIIRPTTVIGFSDGATAALTMANHNPYIVSVYAHSPMFRSDVIRTHASIRLFFTTTDKTPTREGTWKVFERYSNHLPLYPITVRGLEPLPALPVRSFATWVMKRKNHQFHNCLPYLPQELLK